MLLSEILIKMNEDGELNGDMSFETLALAGTDRGCRILAFIDSPKYVSSVSQNSVVLTTPEIAPLLVGNSVCVCAEPRLLFFKIHNFLSDNESYRRKPVTTITGSNCHISKMAYIAETNVQIGDNVVIEEFVSIKENTVIGNNCIIRAGSVIGGEGFEFKRNGDEILSVKHLGGIILGSHVEIQQLSAIDKAVYPWDNTVIGDYTKVDNLVHIAHAVKIKKRTLIVALSCIGGRTALHNDVWVGMGAKIINGITVGDNARVNLGSVVTKNVSDNESVTGNFAIEHSKFIRNLKELNK